MGIALGMLSAVQLKGATEQASARGKSGQSTVYDGSGIALQVSLFAALY